MNRISTILDAALVLVAVGLLIGACSDICKDGHRTPRFAVCVLGDNGAIATTDDEIDNLVSVVAEEYQDEAEFFRVRFVPEAWDCMGTGESKCFGQYDPNYAIANVVRIEADVCFGWTSFAHEYAHGALYIDGQDYLDVAKVNAVEYGAGQAYADRWCGK